MTEPSIHIQKFLEYYLLRHFPAERALLTAETGSSEYTCAFQKHAFLHSVFAVDDLADNVDHDPRFDIFYVGGTHGFFELVKSLSFATSRLNESGILVLPHLDVPTTYFCYQYLKEADGLILHQTMENTAFFGYHRTGSFEPGGWMSAGFNIRHYPAFDHLSYTIFPQLPLHLSFAGYMSPSNDELVRGFMVRAGRVYSEGYFSRIRLIVRPGPPLPVHVEIRFRPIGACLRPGAAVDIRFGTSELINYHFTDQREVVASAQVDLPEDGILIVDMFHHALVEAAELGDLLTDLNPFSRPNVELIDIAVSPLKDAGSQRHISRYDGKVSTFTYEGQTFRFFVADRYDSIQAHHYAGEFYEIEELELIRRHLSPGARILDVGANIGNHTVFFEKVLKADRIVTIELQPRVIELLRLNMALNQLAKVDLSKTGIGLGASAHQASIHIPQSFNVAGAQFKFDTDGQFNIVRGDDILADETFDLMKIDIEGMECQAIEGLSATIARSHPMLFVEVWDGNKSTFDEQMTQMGYVVAEEFRRYDVATNYLMRHRDAI